MVDFTRQRTYRTEEPFLTVDPGLPVGTHVFRLVVTDDAGNSSKPVQVAVEIVKVVRPRVPIVDRGA